MIVLTDIQKRLYSQLLDAIAKDDIVMINALMRFGKTALIVHFLNQSEFKRIVVITDQEYKGYLKLLMQTNLKEDEQIFFFRSTQIDQIIKPDFIVVDDLEDYIDLQQFNCKKIYMCGVLNDSFKQNIKSIISYTYDDYIADGQTPTLKIMQSQKGNLQKQIKTIEKQQFMEKYLILIVGQKKNTFDKIQDLKNEYILLYSDNYYDVRNIILKTPQNIILCTQKLTKNISIPLCQFVIIQESQDIIQAAFRCMMYYEGKQNGFVCFLKKEDEDKFRQYFNGVKFD